MAAQSGAPVSGARDPGGRTRAAWPAGSAPGTRGAERARTIVWRVVGALDASARQGLSGWVRRICGGSFPAGTLVVNVVGCFAIVLCVSLVEDRQLLHPTARPFPLVGVLGAFITVSTPGYGAVEVLGAGQTLPALPNVAANAVPGVGAVAAGFFLACSLRTSGERDEDRRRRQTAPRPHRRERSLGGKSRSTRPPSVAPVTPASRAPPAP
ncbi:MAG: fluoride efflux transporter FluC [Planctomycetota bacterium]|jgi:CrcB protein